MKGRISKLRVFGFLFLLLCGRVEAATVYPLLADNDEWSATFFKGRKMGFSHYTTHIGSGFVTITSQTYMKLKSEGVDQITSYAQETVLSMDLRLVSFSLLQEISGHRQKVEGRVKNGESRSTATGGRCYKQG